jgi:type I restriction enzyme S subunit
MSQQELELPRGWVETTIGESLILVNGRAFKPTEWSEDGLPIIRIQNLNNSKKDFNYCNFEVDKRFLIDDNDLLFSWSGTPDTSFGAFIWNRGKAILNQHIFKIIIIENKIDNNFLYYLLNYNVKQYVNKAHGTAGLAHITKGKFEESTLLLAPLNEQKRIVSKIEELFSKIDSTKQSLEHTKLQLEQYRYSLLRSVYSKCERKSLHTICKLISGQHILKEFCNDQKKGSFYITGPSDFGDRFQII